MLVWGEILNLLLSRKKEKGKNSYLSYSDLFIRAYDRFVESLFSYASAAYDGSTIHEWNSQIAEQNIKGAAKETKTVCDGTSKRLPSLRSISVKHIANTDPGPTPTSTPIASTARTPDGNLKPKCNPVGNSVGLYSSATDPVLVPSLNPRNPASVGIIQRETGSQRNASEISATLVEDSKTGDGHNATFGQGSVSVTSETQPIEYEGVGSSQSESTTTHPTAADAKGHQETCLVQPDNTPSKGIFRVFMQQTWSSRGSI